MRFSTSGVAGREDAAAASHRKRVQEGKGKDGPGEQAGEGREDLQKERGGGETGQSGGSKEEEGEGGEFEWFVLVKLYGTLIDAPADGVERRFTSFFSKVALQLDPKAFPEVAAVEVSSWFLVLLIACVRTPGRGGVRGANIYNVCGGGGLGESRKRERFSFLALLYQRCFLSLSFNWHVKLSLSVQDPETFGRHPLPLPTP